MDGYIPSFEDYIQWVEELVMKYGVEIDYHAWAEIKKRITTAST